ncbi:MAG: hypothetical protein J6N20_18445 [Pseudomonas sp.]|nr:hypothetical protein [Pseudomonas sp.]
MQTLPIADANAELQAAFNEVKDVFPDLAYVIYGEDMRWSYVLDSGEKPAFPAGLINTALLEAAADTLDTLPIKFTAE